MSTYPEALNTAVGDQLRRARRAADLTQAQVITASGLSKSTIIKVEAGTREIRTSDIALISYAIGVEPQEIMRRAQDAAAPFRP